MNRLTRLAAVTLLLAIGSSALAACQALAGIKDRTFDGPAGAAGDGSTGPSAQCQEYCTLAKEVCVDSNTLYANDETCLATCALLTPGDNSEPTGDNVACRANQLNLAKQTNEPSTIPDYCANASSGGNGTCGSNCESYCQLYAAACHDDQPELGNTQYDTATCIAKCKGLTDTKSFDVNANYTGDSLQCRLVHTAAATTNPAAHCVHAQLQAQAQATPAGPCIDDPNVTTPDCDSFCRLEMAECTGETQIFETLAQCHAVCDALPKGAVTDIKENSVGCRKYHSYNALVDPAIHCAHTGPGGDGHCGSNLVHTKGVTGNCESYCLLLDKACSASVPGLPVGETFAASFAGPAACRKACGDLDGADPNSGYTVSPLPKGNTLQCRLLHVSRALTKPLAECAAALGGAPCQ